MSKKDFKFHKVLGSGSYGKVFSATRYADGVLYAVKAISMKGMSLAEKKQAVNEIRLLSAAGLHPNICRYYEAFVEDDNIYIVMDYVGGGTIADEIKRLRKSRSYMKEAKIWARLIPCMGALKYLHAEKVLHRDIKPENVFLTKDKNVVLGDLGCSVVMKGGMVKGAIGTPYYMAPELWRRKLSSKPADMWALGVMLFECMSLRPPFDGRTMEELKRNIMYQRTPSLPRHYSPEIRRLCEQLLAKDPATRPDILEVIGMDAVKKNRHHVVDQRFDQTTPFDLIDTIQIPARMHLIALPEAQYAESSTHDTSHTSTHSSSNGSSSKHKQRAKSKPTRIHNDSDLHLPGIESKSGGKNHNNAKQQRPPKSNRAKAAPREISRDRIAERDRRANNNLNKKPAPSQNDHNNKPSQNRRPTTSDLYNPPSKPTTPRQQKREDRYQRFRPAAIRRSANDSNLDASMTPKKSAVAADARNQGRRNLRPAHLAKIQQAPANNSQAGSRLNTAQVAAPTRHGMDYQSPMGKLSRHNSIASNMSAASAYRQPTQYRYKPTRLW